MYDFVASIYFPQYIIFSVAALLYSDQFENTANNVALYILRLKKNFRGITTFPFSFCFLASTQHDLVMLAVKTNSYVVLIALAMSVSFDYHIYKIFVLLKKIILF